MTVVLAEAPGWRHVAHRIASEEEAVAVARALAAKFAAGASARDRDRILPREEVETFSQSGLWAITVPRAFGGIGASFATVARIIAIVSAADPSIGQIPQNHLGVLQAIRSVSDVDQQRLLFDAVLGGKRFGNAFSELAGRTVTDFQTRLEEDGNGVRINGRKFYSSGALLAHLVPIGALDRDGRMHLAIAERDAPGLSVIDDWSSFGQRTTASGTVVLENVFVPHTHVVPAWRGHDRPNADGAVSQLIQAAVDAGIASGTLDATIAFIRDGARPWVDSGLDRAADDPYTIRDIGDLATRLHAAEALLERAGVIVDEAVASPNDETVAEASVAVAEAKILTTEIAILATNKLFELSGTRSTLAQHNLDRHWRNARTHTLHDPVRWKFHHVGNYALTGTRPPRHAWI